MILFPLPIKMLSDILRMPIVLKRILWVLHRKMAYISRCVLGGKIYCLEMRNTLLHSFLKEMVVLILKTKDLSISLCNL